ncbi:MAG: carboxylesterase family protein [Aestuariivita sp.]|uniref:carboxylesterase family protein n=1 Tax=Aestuariivita sp. TaxID=1872407 RepID=UPI003BB088B0
MSEPVFETKNGTVRGSDLGAVTRIARLRYAEPPTGPRRFAPPEPIAPWQGTLDCSAGHSPVPPQLQSRLAKVMGDYPADQDEDCLHLDIWVPNARSGPLPVLVFIHGGAFMTGGGGLGCYDGTALAEREGIIVVNISYRLGVLGFLPIEGIAPGNLGLMDQETALRFTRANIAGMGGDAGNIIVSGQSAGAYSIQAMLARDDASALFDRAVVMSSPMGIDLKPPAASKDAADSFLAELGEAPHTASISKILGAQAALLRGMDRAPDDVTPSFLPVLDGEYLSVDPAAPDAAKHAAWCPMIAGVTREEHAAFHYKDEAFHAQASALIETRFTERYGARAATELARARRRRIPTSDAAVLIDHGSRGRFVVGTFDYVEALAAAEGQVWAYVFAWQSPTPEIGACHCIELPFVFGNLATWANAPMLKGAGQDELEALARMFGGALGAFARSGDPAGNGGVEWPTFNAARAYLTVDTHVSASGLLPGYYPC